MGYGYSVGPTLWSRACRSVAPPSTAMHWFIVVFHLLCVVIYDHALNRAIRPKDAKNSYEGHFKWKRVCFFWVVVIGWLAQTALGMLGDLLKKKSLFFDFRRVGAGRIKMMLAMNITLGKRGFIFLTFGDGMACMNVCRCLGSWTRMWKVCLKHPFSFVEKHFAAC